jgi:predicted PurR-regulated permease PerM
MEKKELKKYLTIAAIAIIVFLTVKNSSGIIWFGKILISAVYPLFIGCIIAYIFNIFLSYIEKYYFPSKQTGFIAYTRRPVCLVLALVTIITLMALILKIVIPELITAVKLITDEIPELLARLKSFAIEYMDDYPDIQQKIADIDVDLSSYAENVLNFIKGGAVGVISSVADFISAFTLSVTRIIIAIIFAVYLLLRKDKLREDIRRSKNAFLNEKANKFITRIFHVANETFRKFFVGQFIEAIILGTLCTLGMAVLRMPYAGITGTVIGATALVPIIGAYIGGIVGAFMICTVDMKKAVWFVIFLIILQQIENNLIYPRIVGSSVGLPGIWVLAAVTVGGSLFGVGGMLLGVPAVATFYKIYHAELDTREQKINISAADNHSDGENPPQNSSKNSEQNTNQK